jgi:hypothetical protein
VFFLQKQCRTSTLSNKFFHCQRKLLPGVTPDRLFMGHDKTFRLFFRLGPRRGSLQAPPAQALPRVCFVYKFQGLSGKIIPIEHAKEKTCRTKSAHLSLNAPEATTIPAGAGIPASAQPHSQHAV